MMLANRAPQSKLKQAVSADFSNALGEWSREKEIEKTIICEKRGYSRRQSAYFCL